MAFQRRPCLSVRQVVSKRADWIRSCPSESTNAEVTAFGGVGKIPAFAGTDLQEIHRRDQLTTWESVRVSVSLQLTEP